MNVIASPIRAAPYHALAVADAVLASVAIAGIAMARWVTPEQAQDIEAE